MAWVSWDIVTRKKEEGGLGLARLDECNRALLLKWYWRYLTEQQALWRKVVDSIHGTDRKWGVLPFNSNISGVWKNLATLCSKIKSDGNGVTSMIRGRVGNGRDIRFWIDPWLCQAPLKDSYPDLFLLDSQKQCRVHERVECDQDDGRVTIKWKWKRALGSVSEIDHKEELEASLLDCNLSRRRGEWVWNDVKKDTFTVAGAKIWLRGKTSEENSFGFKWCKWLPAKCNIFMWRAFLDRLPTKVALQRRNIHVQDEECGMCGEGPETTDHILTGCGIAAGVWNGISTWCRIPPLYAFSTKDLVHIFDQTGHSGILKKVIQGIIIITSWSLWKARNEKLFSNKAPKVVDLVSDVKVLGYLWYNNRVRRGLMNWEKWCTFDLL